MPHLLPGLTPRPSRGLSEQRASLRSRSSFPDVGGTRSVPFSTALLAANSPHYLLRRRPCHSTRSCRWSPGLSSGKRAEDARLQRGAEARVADVRRVKQAGPCGPPPPPRSSTGLLTVENFSQRISLIRGLGKCRSKGKQSNRTKQSELSR